MKEKKIKINIDSNEFDDIKTSIQKWIDKNEGNVQFICSFIVFKDDKEFKITDDIILAYGQKEGLEICIEGLVEQLKKDRNDFVNW